MPDLLPDPFVSALLELSDPVPIGPGPSIEPPSGNPRRTGAALAAAALAAGIVLGAAVAPGPTPSTAASAYTVKVLGAGATGSGTAGSGAVASAAAPPAAVSDGALASGSPAEGGTSASTGDDGGSADGTGVPDDKSGDPPASKGPSGAASSGGASGSPAATSQPTTPGPVWLISAGSVDINAALTQNAGLQALAQGGLRLPNYTPLADTELANGVALLSGKGLNENYAEADTLAGQLRASNRSWKAYVEDLGSACSSSAANDYDPNRNPFVHFTSISPADCVDRDVDLSALDTDLAQPATTPALSWIVPDTVNDGTGPNGVAYLEDFLTTTIDKIRSTNAYKARGLILIVPDGSPAVGQPAGALLLSPSLAAGTDNASYGPYALLRGLEDRLGLPALGHAGDPTSSPTPIPSH